MPTTFNSGQLLVPDYIPATATPTALTIKGLQQAAVATANSGTVNIGPPLFDGSSAFHFVGNANGTHLAINGANAFTGALADMQVGGVSVLFVSGTKAVGINTQSAISSLTVAALSSGDGFTVTGSTAGGGIAPQFSLNDTNLGAGIQQRAAFGFAAAQFQFSHIALPQDVVLRCLQATANGRLIITNQSSQAIIFAMGGSNTTDVEIARFSPAGYFGAGTSGSDPHSTLETQGSFGLKVNAQSGAYTATATDTVIETTGASQTITLPAATSCLNRVYIVTNGPGQTGTTTVNGGGTNINSAATASVPAGVGGALRLISNGTIWLTI